MARKSALEPKEGQGPGYVEAGYIGKGNPVLMTYRVSGLADQEAMDLACQQLWSKMRKGLSADWGAHGTHEATAGPKYGAAPGEVVYTLHTLYQGEAQEAAFASELQRLTGGRVEMAYKPAPPPPAPIPGIDAPALEAVGK